MNEMVVYQSQAVSLFQLGGLVETPVLLERDTKWRLFVPYALLDVSPVSSALLGDRQRSLTASANSWSLASTAAAMKA